MSKMCLDNSAGGSLHKKKAPEETIELIELVASNQYLYSSNRNPVNSEAPQKKGVMEVEALNAILAQNKLMSQQINLLTQHMGGMQVSAINTQNPPQEVSYDMAGNFIQNDNYDYAQPSSEQVNYMGSSPRNPNNDPYSKTYNQGWRNHPNFGWRDQPQRPQNFHNSFQSGVQQNNDLEAILTGFRQGTRASIKNLEIQMGQIATRVNEIDQRTTDSLPGNTIPNPREECMAITLISGQVASIEAQVMQETRASIRNLEMLVGQLSKQILERSASTFQDDIVVNRGEDCKLIQLRSGKVAGSETKVNEELVEREAPEEKKEEVEHAPPKRMKVVLTSNPAWVYTVIRILSLEHIELHYGDIGKKFKVRGEELSPYDPPP
ncbi:hypothetical protein AHAS_Ahas07G0157400 [Arachis hypogaea]